MENTFKQLDNLDLNVKNKNLFIKSRRGLFKLLYLFMSLLFIVLFIIFIISDSISIKKYNNDIEDLTQQKNRTLFLFNRYKEQGKNADIYYKIHSDTVTDLKKKNISLQENLNELRTEFEKLNKANDGIEKMNIQYEETYKQKKEENQLVIDETERVAKSNSNLEKLIKEIEYKL